MSSYIQCTAKDIRPNRGSMKIEFLATINNKPDCRFDPFVSCHLEWFEALNWIGKEVRFMGFVSEDGCFLISSDCWLINQLTEIPVEPLA